MKRGKILARFKYFDYTMKVMLPDILIKIYKDTFNATYSEPVYVLSADFILVKL